MNANQVIENIRAVADRIYDVNAAGKDLGRVSSSDLVTLGSALKEFGSAFPFSVQLFVEAGGNNETKRATFIAPAKCELLEIQVVKPSAVTGDPTLSINNRDAALNSDKNALQATNFDLGTLATVNEAESLTLSSTEANKQLAKGDTLTFSVVDDADDSHGGFGVLVLYKLLPDA